jgi:DeoR/GlpR family transcriptional regulator of sugar metabolism
MWRQVIEGGSAGRRHGANRTVSANVRCRLMLSQERQRLLLQHLRLHGSDNVVSIAHALAVSPSTVRRDLHEMSERGLLSRVHGGASVLDGDQEPVLSARVALNADVKRRIGSAAAQLVPDESTLLITGGTTTEAMLPFLVGHYGLTVLTNGLNIAYQLTRATGITVVVLGGVLRHEEASLLGPIAERALEEFHVDIAFTGAYGIHPEGGVYGANVTEAGTDRRLLQAAERLIVLADTSKFGRRGPVRLVETRQIAVLVTDTDAPAEALAVVREQGVGVVIA